MRTILKFYTNLIERFHASRRSKPSITKFKIATNETLLRTNRHVPLIDMQVLRALGTDRFLNNTPRLRTNNILSADFFAARTYANRVKTRQCQVLETHLLRNLLHKLPTFIP